MSSARAVAGQPPPFLQSLNVQVRVIGAVMLRELHTRFGRNNIGYLWLVLEPMILSGGVSVFHLFTNIRMPFGFSPGTFYSSGYITYIIFRNNVNRATTLIHANRPLLFHRNCTLWDMTIARVLLDVMAASGAMILILGFYTLTGLSPVPERPWLIVGGIALMAWLSLGLSAMISGASEFSPVVERFVHPATYLLIPFSGMFTVMDELPRPFAVLSSYFPFPHIADLVREGLSSGFTSTYMNLWYVVGFSAVSTALGILLLQIARRRMHFE